MSIPAGTRLGPYEIVSLIGAGGMGEVYRARDPRLARDVAIKVLHSGGGRSWTWGRKPAYTDSAWRATARVS